MHRKAISHKLNGALAIFNTEGHASFVRFAFVGDVNFNAIVRRPYAIANLRIVNEHLAVINIQRSGFFATPPAAKDFKCIAVTDFVAQRLDNLFGIVRRNALDPVTGSPISR